ncbi:glycosyltransferase [Clostridium sp. D46t1_190503_E9]|uniref:glycosyltransferase n=1 Tax=Clostridium sp. D46t1_190503_E9 TaxID=2787137 RepID=UPI001896EA9F|nr:glycosyltransferase [Clostridium sp. D46t1_190503_E9]
MIRILIGSPIHQKPAILKEFLLSLKELNSDDLFIEYCFIDDNNIEESSLILNKFKEDIEKVTILKSEENTSLYICDDYTHRWSNDLIRKVSNFKNTIIEKALKEEYDYLFLVDSDLVMHPKTLKRLVSLKKEIVSNIFWTRWQPNNYEQPQVWLKDMYTLYEFEYGENLSGNEVMKRTSDFINMLRKPGTYKVGGLGACTLISKEALSKGVNFNPVYNISFWGEDRHFCIRAAVLGIQLYVDTYYPAHHIYRDEDLGKISEYKSSNIIREFQVYSAKAYETLEIALEGIGDYSYKKDIPFNYLEFFEEEEQARLRRELIINRKIVLEEKITNKIRIISHQTQFTNNVNEIVIKVVYNELGYRNSYSYYEEKQSEFTLQMDKDGNYKIIKWISEGKRDPVIKPLVRKAKEEGNKLTLSMIVKNEENRFLKKVLEDAKQYIDNAVIIDDGSTDNTVGIIKEVLGNIPYKLIENIDSKFSNEVTLRKQQWEETIKINPDWIIFLDADEIFENRFKYNVRDLMKNTEVDGYMFRLYDFWDEEHYREDDLWNAHNTYRLFMIRYQENYNYLFRETPQHCGRMPYNCNNLAYELSSLRLKHYGWSRSEDRKEKFERYMKLDPEGKFGILAQYYSILDKNPNLKKWIE